MKVFIYFVFLLFNYAFSEILNTPCHLEQTKYGSVCKCTVDYCDYLEEPQLSAEGSWFAVSSSKNGLRFFESNGQFNSSKTYKINDYHEVKGGEMLYKTLYDDTIVLDDSRTLFGLYGGNKNYFNLLPKAGKSVITINRSKTFQNIVGFGGALTGSVAHLLEKMQSGLRNHLYKSYFHQNGIGYNMLRTSIGGCDFDLEPWAYNEAPVNDKHLTNFKELDQRDLLKIKQIKEIKSKAELDDIKIIAAAWSPPPWMKSNSDWSGFSCLKPEYYETWAQYHLRYLELMLAKNITIWAISTGNEPLNGVIGWMFVHFMSLGWTPKEQAIYLNDFLGPAIRKSKFKNVLIFGNDDQRYSYPIWFEKMNSSRPTSIDYLDGLAVHWYWDDIFGPDLIDATLKLMPDKLLISTEACVGDKPWQTRAPELGSWERGEKYIKSILQDLQHNFNGWIDWNLLLNEAGGPNYIQNTVDAPVIINTTNYAEFYKQPMFYAIGHFSKFLKEHSKRIKVEISSPQNAIDAVGFKRPDNKIILIIFNSAAIPQDINLNDSLQGLTTINVAARSIHTIIYA